MHQLKNKNTARIILTIIMLYFLIGCSTIGGMNGNNEQKKEGPVMIVPPLPKHSTCEQGKLETIVLSADGGAKIWYYNNNNFLSIDFRSGINVRITKATETAFCYDYF